MAACNGQTPAKAAVQNLCKDDVGRLQGFSTANATDVQRGSSHWLWGFSLAMTALFFLISSHCMKMCDWGYPSWIWACHAGQLLVVTLVSKEWQQWCHHRVDIWCKGIYKENVALRFSAVVILVPGGEPCHSPASFHFRSRDFWNF